MERKISTCAAIFLCGMTVLSGCAAVPEYANKTEFSITVVSPVNGSASVYHREKRVDGACAGDRLQIACLPDIGYELKSVKVDNTEIYDVVDGTVWFGMPNNDVTVEVEFQAIVRSVTVNDSAGGTIAVDKTSAAYGELVTVTVEPDDGYFGKERSLCVNNTEIYRGRVYEHTDVSFVMPNTDAVVSMSFSPMNFNRGEHFGDYSANKLSRGIWNYDDEQNGIISVSLSAAGTSASVKDSAYTYYLGNSDFVYFSAAAKITEWSKINNTYENSVGYFIGDGNSLAKIGFAFKGYASMSDQRAYYLAKTAMSLSFDGGRKEKSGLLSAIKGANETTSSGVINSSFGGVGNIARSDLGNYTLRFGFIYDKANGKLHTLYTDFAADSLLYFNAVNLSNIGQFYNADDDGKITFGLFAESSFDVSLDFFDIEYSTDRQTVIAEFPQVGDIA